MTALVLTGQLEPVRPLAVRSFFMRNTEGDLAALKAITDTFAVPSWVAAGGGTIGSQRANLSDDQIEACVRDAIWRLVNYTGTLDSGGPTTYRTLDLYNWIIANAALNAALGPTIDCGNIAALHTGFLAAYGIPGRRIWSHDGAAHTIDTTNEYWSPVYGWVHVVAHNNTQAQWVATGKPASMLDVATVGAQLGTLAGVITHVPQGGSIGAGFRSNIATDVNTYIDYTLWGRGNRLQFAAGAPGDPNYLDNGNASLIFTRFAPPTANAWATQVNNANAAQVVTARDITDITYTPSALMASARLTTTGLAEVALDALMLDTGFTYQVKAPAGSWVGLIGSGHSFYPVPGQAWAYRALGPLGNTSNVVTVTIG